MFPTYVRKLHSVHHIGGVCVQSVPYAEPSTPLIRCCAVPSGRGPCASPTATTGTDCGRVRMCEMLSQIVAGPKSAQHRVLHPVCPDVMPRMRITISDARSVSLRDVLSDHSPRPIAGEGTPTVAAAINPCSFVQSELRVVSNIVSVASDQQCRDGPLGGRWSGCHLCGQRSDARAS